jgi:hypothetical protein
MTMDGRCVRHVGPWLSLLIPVVVVAALLGTPPATGQTGGVAIHLEAGVPNEISADFQRATGITQQFFKSTYGVDLTRQVRMLLVPNATAYVSTMVREWGITQAEGARRARTTTGWSSGQMIIINVERTPSSLRRFNLAAHELTHQYQAQITIPVSAWSLYWFPEGMADLMSWRITEIGGVVAADEQRRSWLAGFRQAPARPDLSSIDNEPKWFAALEAYVCLINVYRVAAFAVEYLANDRASLAADLISRRCATPATARRRFSGRLVSRRSSIQRTSRRASKSCCSGRTQRDTRLLIATRPKSVMIVRRPSSPIESGGVNLSRQAGAARINHQAAILRTRRPQRSPPRQLLAAAPARASAKIAATRGWSSGWSA